MEKCRKCNLTFGSAEVRVYHNGQLYHESCWEKLWATIRRIFNGEPDVRENQV